MALNGLFCADVLLRNYSLTPTGDGGPLTIFFKIGLKCNKGALITSELGGVARRNFGT